MFVSPGALFCSYDQRLILGRLYNLIVFDLSNKTSWGVVALCGVSYPLWVVISSI